jgi:chaperonin GroES
MSKIQATNNFVFIIRDAVEKEKEGIYIPGQGREKPSQGDIVSVGELARDTKIVNGIGKKCLFHKGIGFSIEIDGVEYLVLTDNEIIGVK